MMWYRVQGKRCRAQACKAPHADIAAAEAEAAARLCEHLLHLQRRQRAFLGRAGARLARLRAAAEALAAFGAPGAAREPAPAGGAAAEGEGADAEDGALGDAFAIPPQVQPPACVRLVASPGSWRSADLVALVHVNVSAHREAPCQEALGDQRGLLPGAGVCRIRAQSWDMTGAPDMLVLKGLSCVAAGCRRALDRRPGRAAGGRGRARAGHAAPPGRGRRRRERVGGAAGAAGARAPLARGPCGMRHARRARDGELCCRRALVRVHACATNQQAAHFRMAAAPEAAARPPQDAARALQGSQAQVQGCQAALRRHGAAGARIVTPQALCALAANCQARCAGTAVCRCKWLTAPRADTSLK
jgi:hypothetical protein